MEKNLRSTRPKIGLALGSGGAKGPAHLGVLKVLHREGIKVDYIAGTSIGAMVGGLYALDQNLDYIEQAFCSLDTKKIFSLYKIGWHQKGFMSGEKILEYINQLTHGASIESCSIPFTAVATNIKNGDVIRLSKGSLSVAIRASSAVPLLFTPANLDNMTLVDGGLSETVPVNTVKKMGADVVIAVNLEGSYFAQTDDSGVGVKTLAINSYNILKYNLAALQVKSADVVITPQVGDPRLWEVNKCSQLITAGELAAENALPEIKKLLK